MKKRDRILIRVAVLYLSGFGLLAATLFSKTVLGSFEFYVAFAGGTLFGFALLLGSAGKVTDGEDDE